MDYSQRAALVDALKKPFELSEHNIRTGGRGKWFVFVKKEAIINRLDALVPMDWHTNVTDTVRIDDRVEVVMQMTIAGVSREFDGVAEDNRKKAYKENPEVLYPLNTRKAATTDAFKRVAMCFGIGLYLLDVGVIESGSENDAKQVFARWYRNRFEYNKPATQQQQQQQPQPSGNGSNPAPQAAPKTMSAIFNRMRYSGATARLQLGNMGDPGLLAVVYGGRGAIKAMCGDDIHGRLNLAQFDAIKGKNITSDWQSMTMPIEFDYVTEVRNDGSEYDKIISVTENT